MRIRSIKKAIPASVRRGVAIKYGGMPGEKTPAQCHYCGADGVIHWWRLSSGEPSAWVTFPSLELDHEYPESQGGKATVENVVLACRRCNRRKKDKVNWDGSD